MKFLILITLMIFLSLTLKKIVRLKRNPRSRWPEVRKMWGLIGLELALLGGWILTVHLGMSAPIDPLQTLSNLWANLRAR